MNNNIIRKKMLGLKKFYREELLQLALLLSLLRVDPENYLGIDIQSMGVGSLNLNNGSGWHTDTQTIIHRPMFVHPKNLDTMMFNYESYIFDDLNSLGRYNNMNTGLNNIHAYLLNIEENGRDDNHPVAGTSIGISTSPGRNVNSPDPPTDTQTDVVQHAQVAELTQEVYLFFQLFYQIYQLCLSAPARTVIILKKEFFFLRILVGSWMRVV